MRKLSVAMMSLAVLGTPALAQVRPQDCRPVFPLTDPVQAALPQDVFAERAIPAAVSRRGFFGLPFLPLIAGGGVCAIFCGSGDGDGDGDGETPVSPA